MDNRYAPYIITKRREETPTVVELVLAPKEGARPAFVPGQFIDILLPSHGADAKSYTISSTPHEEGFTIAVRRAGTFSQALCDKKEGEVLSVSEPYGFFYPVDAKTPRLFLAGGIGITPCISIARAGSAAGERAPTLVYYSNRSYADVA
ncbi:MAG: FAD-binding oxidoreductase, partial [Patescibacteria group bacterium]